MSVAVDDEDDSQGEKDHPDGHIAVEEEDQECKDQKRKTESPAAFPESLQTAANSGGYQALK